MIYIDGVGYVNEVSSNILNVNKNEQVPADNDFDDVFAKETAALSGQRELSLEEIFKEASETYGIPEEIIKAVAYTESRFNPNDTSSSGAMGIMQLMPSTASALGVQDAYDPYDNIMGGTKLLRQLSDLYDGDLNMMLAGYNAGSGAVARYGGIPPYESVNHYIEKVHDALNSGVSDTVPDVTYTVGADKANNTQAMPRAEIDYNRTGASAVAGTTASADTAGINKYNNSLSAEAAAALQKTGETATTNIYNYRTGNSLNSLLSYSQYELLFTFYENMIEIISRIGDTGSNNDNDSTSSYLYNNLRYNRNNINLFTDLN